MKRFAVAALCLLIPVVSTIAASQTSAGKSKPKPQAAAPRPKPTGSLAQIMRGIYFPNSNLIFDVQQHDPAVPVKKSITAEYIVCLEDGKKFKSLKRHLRTQYNITPEQYREKWGLPPDYPMVAPNYAAARSQLAKQMGLGQQRRRRAR